MNDRQKLVADLLVSVSGVLLFLSVAHFIDLNGFSKFSPLLILVGAAIVVWNQELAQWLAPTKILSKQVILTLAHVTIFLGLKTYLTGFLNGYWTVIFVIGVILLNTNQYISEKLF